MTAVTIVDRAGARVTFEARDGQRILHAGLLAGIGLPYECGSGTCGSCKARCLAGEVHELWPAAPGRKVIRQDGEVLMCQARCAGPAVELSIRGALAAPPEPAVTTLDGVMVRTSLLTPDVGMFSIALPRPMDHAPGQFVLVEIDGCEGPRAYSMTRSAAGEPNLELLIRRLPGGVATGLLFGPAPGRLPVRVTGPLGRAVFRPQEDRPFVILAGGSGLAGMLAILDAAAQSGQFRRHRNTLVFGLRDPGSAYLLGELNRLAGEAGEGLAAVVAFSDAAADDDIRARHPHLRFAKGFVHEVAAQLPAAALGGNPVHFVAGPPPMVDAAMRWLVMDRKVAPTEVRYDRFG